MALDLIPNTKLFTQRDVRETPSSTATATAVGLTDPQYLTLATDADLTNERVLTAGEGIDFTDAGAGSTLTINGENASDTNKGIASFSSTDFSVSSGAVSLANKTSYLSIPAAAFTPAAPDVCDIDYITDGGGNVIDNSGYDFICPVMVPHNSVVTGVIVYGNSGTSDVTWTMYRNPVAAVTSDTMATANCNTEDTTISNGTIDNSAYRYHIVVGTLAANDRIYGARIKYTTDYD